MSNSKTEMTTLSVVLEKLRLKKQDNEFRMTKSGLGSKKENVTSRRNLKLSVRIG